MTLDRGHLFLAQNGDINYVRQAYALALSIKANNQHNQTCIVTNDEVPFEYNNAFDHIVKIPWNDSAKDSVWKIENRWKLIYVTPFKHNIVYDTDMLVLTSNDHWWDFLEKTDLMFTSSVIDYRGNTITDDHYRKMFTSNELPNIYFGLHYFKKTKKAFEFYKWLELVVKNWKLCYNKYAPVKNQGFCSMDVSSAIAVKILDSESECTVDALSPSFTHMKPALQKWSHVPDKWTNNTTITFNSNLQLTISNCLQTGVFHYTEDEFLTDDIITKLEQANV